MMMSEKLPSKLEALPDFIAGILDKLKKQKIAEEDLFNIKLSLEESLVNAVKYGNKKPKLLRAYFSPHNESKKIIVGHCGDHLENYSSQFRK